MATPEAESQAEPGPDRFPWYRLSVRQFLKMIDAGVFPDHVRVELLGGALYQNPDRKRPRPGPKRKTKLIDRPPSGPMRRVAAHDYSILAVATRLRRLLGDGWLVSERRSIPFGAASRATPDVAVLRGPVELYKDREPSGRDVELIVEVAGASYPQDRGQKWRRYAAEIPIYWIVNLAQRQIEVYRQPNGFGSKAAYGSVEVFGDGAVVPVVIAGVEVGRVAVADILP